jgi:tetratricopeptide (TPR) repeat protein
MNRVLRSTIVATSFLVGVFAVADRESQAAAPELKELGAHQFRITTGSGASQRAFNRGLTLAYSFGHFAAEQEFRKAVKSDQHCAMAYWGIALVNGPHINFPLVPPDKAAMAWENLNQAKQLVGRCSPLEQALVKALESRYANPQPEDRSSLDAAYAAAMRSVWKEYSNNADVAVLFAEAAMDLHPWDFWTNGVPQPWTSEILEALGQALRLDPKNPGANHYYIHVVEASPRPENALAEADRLRRLVPDSSHMVHMPSHIYSRTGRWEAASESNREAIRVDALYRKAYPRPGLYSIYMAHNMHFLAWVYMMQGRSDAAISAARHMVKEIPEDFLKEYASIADGYMAIVPEVLMRFGRWDEILQEPEPRSDLILARALWRYTRAVALTALDKREEAQVERAALAKAKSEMPPDHTMGNNPASQLLEIATLVLEGEAKAKERDYTNSISRLEEAARLEDSLRYDEPPDWIQPVRHTLGAVLLRAGRAAEAENVYREELRRNPENGWGLMGLHDALNRQGKQGEAIELNKRLRKAWAKADISPKSTCYCQISE